MFVKRKLSKRGGTVSEEKFDCACLNDDPLGVSEFLELDTPKTIFLLNPKQNELRKQLCKFIKDNNHSDDAKDFAKEAIEALIKDGEVDFDLQIMNQLIGTNITNSHVFDWNEFYFYNSLPGLHNTTSFQNEIQNNPVKNQLYKAYEFVGKKRLGKDCN